jgi:nucleoside-diphosphate-sugar epimerase
MTKDRMADRRTFIKTAAAGSAFGLTMSPAALAAQPSSDSGRPRRPMRILILGGTGFTGPHQVRYAVGRGHTVTVFNRGRRQADLPDGVEHLQGDRNDDLKSLENRKWDVVIDNPTTLPNWVRLAGKLLHNAADQYIFISTISVYGDTSVAGMDETTPVLEYQGETDPFEVAVADAGRSYGPLKALSEREAAYWFPGRATIIRPGLIVGPGDQTDRFTYWPVRVARGGEVLAPGKPEDATQIVDARDLAEWTIRMAETGEVGIFNATGPNEPRPIGKMLEGLKSALKSDATFTFVNQDFLQQQSLRGWSDMPVWVPTRGNNDGFMRVSVARAVAKGLTYRPLDVTARETLAWFRTLPAERQQNLVSGVKPEREREVLAAWHASKG